MTSASTYTYEVGYNPSLGVVTRADARKKGVQGFLSTDPRTGLYAFSTPYSFAGNSSVMAVDVNGEHPGIAIGAGIGFVGGGLVGFFTTKGSFRDRLKSAGKGAAIGVVSGAIIGSGVGLVAIAASGSFAATGIGTTAILAGSGTVAGGAGSVMSQGFEMMEGTRARGDFSEEEIATDMLIGAVTAPLGGRAGGEIAKHSIKAFSKLGITRSISNEARRAWKSHIKDGLRGQGYKNRALNRLARQTYNQTKEYIGQSEAVNYFRFSLETGAAVLTEVIFTTASQTVDENVGDDKVGKKDSSE